MIRRTRRSRWTRALTLLTLGLSLSSAPARSTTLPNAEAISLSMDQCIGIALSQATAVLKSQNDLDVKASQVLQSYAQFLPDLNAGASYGYQSGTTLYTINGRTLVDSSGQTASYRISSTLNLFNGLSDYAGLKSALSLRDSSFYSLDWARQQVALDITQTYLQLILDMQELDIAQKNLLASEARLKLLRAQARVGSATLADLYRQEAQTSADTLSKLNYEARVRDDQVILLRKLKLEQDRNYLFETPLLVPARDPLADLPLDELTRRALDRRADLRSVETRTEAASWDVTRARSGYFPRLDLSFQHAGSGQYLDKQVFNGADVLNYSQPALFSQLGPQSQNSVVLALTWNLFDRFVTRQQVEQARINQSNARIDLEDAQRAIASDVRVAVNDYQIAWTQIETARTGLKAAEQAYDAVMGRYQVGAASFIDVLSAQATLTQARSSLAQAQVNLKLQERTLQYALGRL